MGLSREGMIRVPVVSSKKCPCLPASRSHLAAAPGQSTMRPQAQGGKGPWWPRCGAITHMLQLGKPPAAHLRGTAAMTGSLPAALQHSWCVGSSSCRDRGCCWAARGCLCRASLPQVMDFSSGLSLRVKSNSAGEIPLLSHSKGNSKSFSSLAFLPAHLIAKSRCRGSPGQAHWRVPTCSCSLQRLRQGLVVSAVTGLVIFPPVVYGQQHELCASTEDDWRPTKCFA